MNEYFTSSAKGVEVSGYINDAGDPEINICDASGDNITISLDEAEALVLMLGTAVALSIREQMRKPR